MILLSSGWLNKKFRQTYALIDTQVHTSPSSLAVFPPSTEVIHTSQKIGDVEALDRAAFGTDYRPKTCLIRKTEKHLPHKGCPLIVGEQYVAKRSNSASSQYMYDGINIVDRKSRHHNKHIHEALGIDRWYYQERVSFLKEVGEFRVFITARLGTYGIRQSSGKHLHMVFTRSNRDGGFAA